MSKAGKKHRVKQRTDLNKHDIEEKLTKARVSLLIRHPFFGNMATRLQLEEADNWCDTAATDGRKFYYNKSFIDGLTIRETEFLFAHEVLHNAFEHLLRRHDRDPKLFNIAADYAVNQILVDARIGKQIQNTLLDPKYSGMSAEEIYDILFDNAEKINIDDLLDQLLDEHIGNEDADDGAGNKDSNDKRGRPRLSDSERKKIRQELKESLLAAAHCAGAGNLPAGLSRLIEGITSPKLNWRDILRQQIQSTIKSDYTFLRSSKKSHGTQFRLPGLKRDETIDICVGIDASGSIDQQTLKDFLSEVSGIMQQYDDYQIHVWSYDTQVYNVEVYRADEGRDVSTYQTQGGGGTNFDASYDYMKENNIVPKTYINFTDLYPCGSFGDESYCDTIFVACKNASKQDAPFGLTIRLD